MWIPFSDKQILLSRLEACNDHLIDRKNKRLIEILKNILKNIRKIDLKDPNSTPNVSKFIML